MTEKIETRVLNIAVKAAEILLENGSEIYRVEQSVIKITNFFGFKSQCFATLTCIIITIEDSEFLIQNIEKYDMKILDEKLNSIKKEAPYSFKWNLLANCCGASFFSILFSGTTHDFFSAFIAAFLLGVFSKISKIINLGIFFHNLACSFIITITVCFLYYLNFITDISVPIISTLMLLVPGVAFINSMRDIFEGDLVTGTSRLLEVFMVGTSIAVGSGIALNLFYSIGGNI